MPAHSDLTVTVPVATILEQIRANRDAHRAIFEKALDGYRDAMIAELEARIDDVKRNKQIDKFLRLPEPEDHTRDYDRVIAMLEMHTCSEIDLDMADFGRYVRDEWDWKEQWFATASTYTSV